MLDRVVDIKTQFLEVGDDDIARVFVLVLIAKCLALNVAEVCRFVVFEFDYSDDLNSSSRVARPEFKNM